MAPDLTELILDRAHNAAVSLDRQGRDLGTIPELTEYVEERLDGSREALVLDLSEVTFMDSSGVRLLIELHARARAQNWTLSLIRSAHESANAVLRMTGADVALPFAATPRR